MTDLELFDLAVAAAGRAYAPYSGFCVGAALLCGSGEVYLGANVENAAYGASVCAERVAAGAAAFAGEREFLTLAVAAFSKGGEGAAAWPCGICRQFLFEFGGGLRVVAGKSADSLEAVSLDALLAHGFRLED